MGVRPAPRPSRQQEVRRLAVLTDTLPALGSRLWLYGNFDCNLAREYCCAESSPRTAARRLPVAVARRACEELAGPGGREMPARVTMQVSLDSGTAALLDGDGIPRANRLVRRADALQALRGT